MSDRAPLQDRRRPFIIGATLIMVPALLLLGWAFTFLMLLAAYVILQLASNVAQAAVQGLIPDLVPQSAHGVASGVKIAFEVLGTAIGLLGVAVLVGLDVGRFVAFAYLALVLALGAFLSWRWVPPVPPLPPDQRAHGLGDLLSPSAITSAFTRLRTARAEFRFAVATRFLFLLGIYPVQVFLLLFLHERFGIEDPIGQAAGYILAALVLGIAAAGVGGWLSDRIGHRPVTIASICIAAAGLGGIAVSFTLPMLAVAGAAVAIGFGAFQAVNWALLSDTIPKGHGAQFFGLVNIATAGASALAGLFGPLVDLAVAVLPAGTYLILFSLAMLITLSSLLPLRRMAKASPRSDIR